MKTLVLYKTKYGATEQYARWLAEEIKGSLFKVDSFKDNLDNYDMVLLGSPTYMGKIQIVDFLVKNWDRLHGKKVYLFNIGMISWEEEGSRLSYEAIPQHIREKIGFLKLPGRIVVEKLKTLDKMVSRMMKAESRDMVKKENLAPVLEWVKGQQA